MDQTRDQLNGLLTELAGRIGIDSLALEENGTCQLVIDNAFAINIGLGQPAGNIVFFARVGEIHSEGREKSLQYLLQANRFWVGTGGATLSLDETGRVVLLAYQVPVEHLTVVEFEPLVEWFVNNTETWRARLAELFQGHGEIHGDQNQVGTMPGNPLEGFPGSVLRV